MIDLNKEIDVDRPQLLNEVYDAICDAVQTGISEVIDGDLQWSDMIDVTVRNKKTGKAVSYTHLTLPTNREV